MSNARSTLVELIADSEPRFAEEENALLLVRLRAVTLLLSAGFVGPSRERTVCGTPQYMAPEQITGERAVDGRSDLYALGGVAYSLLTGRPPFDGETATEVMNAHVRDAVVPPSRYRPDIPPDLEEVILRCLVKDPDGRFQSADELEMVLSACASANEWDARKAAGWWEEFEAPGAAQPPWGEAGFPPRAHRRPVHCKQGRASRSSSPRPE
jgi:serine/threonine protein kinase